MITRFECFNKFSSIKLNNPIQKEYYCEKSIDTHTHRRLSAKWLNKRLSKTKWISCLMFAYVCVGRRLAVRWRLQMRACESFRTRNWSPPDPRRCRMWTDPRRLWAKKRTPTKKTRERREHRFCLRADWANVDASDVCDLVVTLTSRVCVGGNGGSCLSESVVRWPGVVDGAQVNFQKPAQSLGRAQFELKIEFLTKDAFVKRKWFWSC